MLVCWKYWPYNLICWTLYYWAVYCEIMPIAAILCQAIHGQICSCNNSLPGSPWSNYTHAAILCQAVHGQIMLMQPFFARQSMVKLYSCSYSLPGSPWSNMLMQPFFARQSMVKLYSCSYSLPGSAWSNYVHTTILCPGVHPKIMLMRQLLFLNICACHCAFCVLKIRSLYLISITVHWQCVGLCYLS